MIITDLDGTLLNSRSLLSSKNRQTLLELQEMGYVRVVATGRILYSVQEIMEEDFPIDYLIFSSGAGILDFSKKELIYEKSMYRDSINQAVNVLQEQGLSFMMHAPVPENNYCLYYNEKKSVTSDLIRRQKIYEDFSSSWSDAEGILKEWEHSSSLILTSVPTATGEQVYEMIKSKVTSCHVVRTTSPLDDQYNWIEILPKNVSKANASSWLRDYVVSTQKKEIKRTMVIGNDYNDLDMLAWADESFVVENAPDLLKMSYEVVASNNNDGFSEAVAIFDSKIRASSINS